MEKSDSSGETEMMNSWMLVKQAEVTGTEESAQQEVST